VRHWDHHTTIFEEGDVAANVFVLLEGVVEILRRLDNGRSLVVKLLVGPTLFGAIEPLGDEPAYLESVRALGTAKAVALDRVTFSRLVEADAALANETLRDTARAFCAAAKAEHGRLFELETLLARMLLAYAELFGTPNERGTLVSLKRTQVELADAVGASERQVQRLLKTWQDSGVLTREDGRLLLLDEEVLRSYAGPLGDSLVHGGA